VRFWALFLRNIKETYRDPLALGFLLAFPLMFMLLFGAAFGGDTTPSYEIAVIDKDNTTISQSFISETLSEVSIFEIVVLDDTNDAEEQLKQGDITAYITVPDGFGQQIALNLQGLEANIQLEIGYDESDLLVAEQIISSTNSAVRAFAGIVIPITIHSNPINIETEITQIDFIGPGIIIFGLLIIIPTSARIMLRDKESRFLNRLLTTPTRPWEFISGYSLSMIIIAIAQIVIFILLARWFGMDIVGNIGLAFFIFLLTAICSIGVGMVVASLSKSENQGESLSWLFSMPLAIISGVWFSKEFMPLYMQTIADIFPFSHAVEAARAVITRGSGFESVASDVYFLIGWAIVIFAIGIILFRQTMKS
jgi:ABC-2 type transport system permease protein